MKQTIAVLLVLAGCASSGKVATVETTTSTVATTTATTHSISSAEVDLDQIDPDDRSTLIASMQSLSRLSSLISVDATAGDYAAVTTDCAQGKVEVREVLALLTSYAGPITAKLTAALIEYRASYDACIGGDFDATVSHLNAGTKLLNEATAMM